MANSGLTHADISEKKREELAEEDKALPDGSFPIRNREDLKKAVEAIGRAADRVVAQTWILKRAKELHAEDELPEWLKNPKSTAEDPEGLEHGEDVSLSNMSLDEFFEHHGIKGMKWGVRRTPEQLGKKGVDDPNMMGLSRRDQRKLTKKGYSGILKGHRELDKPARAIVQELNKRYKAAGKKPDEAYYKEAAEKMAEMYNTRLNKRKGAEVRLNFSVGRLTNPQVQLNNKDVQRNLELASRIMKAEMKARRKVRHADEEVDELLVEVELDEDGFIEDVYVIDEEAADDELEHSDSLAKEVINTFIEEFGDEGLGKDLKNDPTISGYLNKSWDTTLAHTDFDTFLEHYGIPGMRWGVRRDRNTLNRLSGKMNQYGTREKRNGKVSGYRARVGKKTSRYMLNNVNPQSKIYQKIYRKAAGKIRKGTRALNNDPRFKGQNLKKDRKLREEYYSEYRKMVETQLNSAANKGRGKMTLNFTYHGDRQLAPNAYLSTKAKGAAKKTQKQEAKAQIAEIRRKAKVKHGFEYDDDDLDVLIHADEVDLVIPMELSIDDEGFIFDMEIDPEFEEVLDDVEYDETEEEEEMLDEAEHSEIDVDSLVHSYIETFGNVEISTSDLDLFLEHHGIKGMKWGVRRTPEQLGRRKSSGSTQLAKAKKPNYSAKAMKKNMKTMSDDEIRRLMNRIKIEQEYKALLNSSSTKVGSVYTKQWTKQFSQKTLEQLVGGFVSGGANIAGKYMTEYWLKQYLGMEVKNEKKK